MIGDRNANSGIPKKKIIFFRFNDFLCFEMFWDFSVFANQPIICIGGVSLGGSVTVAVGLSDK